MRSRWLVSSSVAVAVSVGLLCWSPVVVAQSGPVCRQGCPCGNACIDCSDTCRIGGGNASRDGTSQGATAQELVGTFVFVGVGLLVMIGGIALWAGLRFGTLPQMFGAEPPKPPGKGKEACRSDDQCPSGFSCVDPIDGVGLCERTQSTDGTNYDTLSGDDWLSQTQRAIDEANVGGAVR